MKSSQINRAQQKASCKGTPSFQDYIEGLGDYVINALEQPLPRDINFYDFPRISFLLEFLL